MSAMTTLGATLLAMALMLAAVQASLVFQNTGTLSGWGSIIQEHRGVVLQETNVVYKGTTALKAQQTYDASYKGRYHSEVAYLSGYKRGDSRFYGFAFRLQSDWNFTTQSYNLGQFIANFSDYGCDEYVPTSRVWLVGNQLYSRVKYGQIYPKSSQLITAYPNLATVSAGAWHTVEIQASWQSDTTGYYILWFDRVKVLEKYNISTTLPDDRAIAYHVGLYASGWHDDGRLVGSQGTRQVWYDQIAIATDYDNADSSWW